MIEGEENKMKYLKAAIILAIITGMIGGAAGAPLFEDSFEDQDMSEYNSLDNDNAGFPTSPVWDGTYSLHNTGATSDWMEYVHSSETFSSEVKYRVWMRGEPTDDDSSNQYSKLIAYDGTSSTQVYSAAIWGGDFTLYDEQDGTSKSGISLSQDTWYQYELHIKGSEVVARVYDTSGNQLDSLSYSRDDGVSSLGIGLRTSSCCNREQYFDLLQVPSLNTAPTIDGKSFSPSDPNKGDSIDAFMNTSDPDGDSVTHTLSVWEGSNKINDSVSMSSSSTHDAELLDVFNADAEKQYTIQYEASDGSTTTKENLTFTIQNDAPTVSSSEPMNKNYTSKNVSWSFSASDNDDVAGETYSCQLYNNGNQFDSYSGTEPLQENGTISSDIHDPQSNTFKVECSDDAGNTNSITNSYYIWRGLNVSAYQKDTGDVFESWNLYLSNSTENDSRLNLSNPVELEYDDIPNGNVTVEVGDGKEKLYYFNKSFTREINSTNYHEENVSLEAKDPNPLTLEFSPGLLVDEGEEVTVEGTTTEGTGTLEREGAQVGNPYTATLTEGYYQFNFSIGETQNYAPNYKTSTLQVLAAGTGCTDNQTYAFSKKITPSTNPYLVDFSDFIDSDRVRSNLGDVYTSTENITLKRTGSNNELLYIDASSYSGSEIDLEWGNYYVNKSYPTTAKPSADQDNLSSYQEQNPYYVNTYKLEQSGDQKLPPGGNTTATLLCDSGATGYKVEKSRYLVAAKEQLEEMKHTVQYSSTDIYQRNLLPTSEVEYNTIWLVDANQNQVVETLFELRDNTGNYGDGFLRLKKSIGGAERVLTEQFFDAESKTVAYLINGEKYTLEVVSGDRSSSRSIGNIYTDTVDLTKTIRINEIYDVDPSSGNISYNLYKESGSVNLDFAFPDGQVDEATLTVFNYTDGEKKNQLYSDTISNKSSGGLSYSVPNSSENATVMAEYYINSSKFGEIEGSQLFQLSYQTPLDDLNINPDTLKAFSVFMIIVIPMFFNPSVARLGALVQVFAAGFFNMIGWIDLSTAAMSSAGTLSLAAILIAIDAYAESEYSRTARRGGV